MAVADTANLLVKMNLGGNFLSQIGKSTKGLTNFDRQLGKTESRAFKAGQQIGTGIRNAGRIAAVGVGLLVSQIGLGLNSLIELEKQTAQTNAVIKSTKGVAGVTATEVGRLAEKFESLNATVGDEFIRAGENMLLTFTNLRGKAFEPATKAILNMNTAMGNGPEGLTKTAILVGKALNDPIKGATALRRVGVTLDAQQQKQIKTLVKQNNLYGAQKIILAELDKEFGGSFAAQGNTTAGKVAKFTDSIEDLQRALAEALLPTLGNVADALSSTLADPKVIEGVRTFGKSLAGLISPKNLADGGKILGEVFNAAREAAPTIAAAAQTMGKVVGAAVSMFRSLPPEIQKLAIGAFAINKLTGGLVTNLASGLIGGVLKQLVSGVVNVRGATVLVSGGVGGAGVPVGGTASGIGRIASIATKVFIIGAAVGVFAELKGILDDQAKQNRDTEVGQQKQLGDFIASGNRAALSQSLANLQKLDRDLTNSLSPEAIAYQLDIDGVRDTLHADMAALQAAIAKLPQADRDRGAKGPTRPAVVDSIRTTTANMAQLEAALARGRAAGFHPKGIAAAEATLQKAASRAAEHQKQAADRLISAALVQVRAGERLSSPMVIPAPITNVTVNVSPTGIVNKYITTTRSGPSGGSRETSTRFHGPDAGP